MHESRDSERRHDPENTHDPASIDDRNTAPGEPSREDILIHRTIDGAAGVADWAELELLARRDPTVWKRLALGMRGELSLRRAGLTLEASLPSLPETGPAVSGGAPLLIGGLGWAAALVITFCWLGLGGLGGDPGPANPGEDSQPAQAWSTYLASGAGAVQELEPIVVEAVPSIDGTTLELVFVRRALERTRLDEIQVIGHDDSGALTSSALPIAQIVTHEF